MSLFKKPTPEQVEKTKADIRHAISVLDTIPASERPYNKLALDAASLAIEAGDVGFTYLIVQALMQAQTLHKWNEVLDATEGR